ncbi:MAG: GNAT family N-acetyltransferase, partial [Clostridia bacterium]|nr:GNAT family N-acetyltransferase [Clostridia bacterium]
MVEIRLIDEAHERDINIPNESFRLFGRMVPRYTDENWDYSVERFDVPSEMCFPDEDYDFAEMSRDCCFLGAYDGESCVGLAVMKQAWFKYMYLYDLKVSKAFRRLGVGSLLIDAATRLARDRGYRGIYTHGQDNNLGACLFYINSGFRIGGLDT